MEFTSDILLDKINHYKNKVIKHSKTGREEKILHAIKKLSEMPVRRCHLEKTGVGITINSLKADQGQVGVRSRELVAAWKSMVQAEDEREAVENEQKNKSATSPNSISGYQDNLSIIYEGSGGGNENTLYSYEECSSNSSDSNKCISINKKRREYIEDDNSSESSVSKSTQILSNVNNSQRKREVTPAERGNKSDKSKKEYEETTSFRSPSSDNKTNEEYSEGLPKGTYSVPKHNVCTSTKSPRTVAGASSKPNSKRKKAPLMAKSVSLMKKLMKRTY
ncbi:hypothetical protein GWI33_002005 [Rhynchophorus ferrugineus]|uniref:TFIIS N-terminal domain-containing protein n=1 Tax=Rhynchophorus ferrugineus TaxID=354439 RepID=A0A834MGK8_RHYFE|nr:hypothetical protein GWI33_002005 [Rhynchophorus ferrugineus]